MLDNATKPIMNIENDIKTVKKVQGILDKNEIDLYTLTSNPKEYGLTHPEIRIYANTISVKDSVESLFSNTDDNFPDTEFDSNGYPQKASDLKVAKPEVSNTEGTKEASPEDTQTVYRTYYPTYKPSHKLMLRWHDVSDYGVTHPKNAPARKISEISDTSVAPGNRPRYKLSYVFVKDEKVLWKESIKPEYSNGKTVPKDATYDEIWVELLDPELGFPVNFWFWKRNGEINIPVPEHAMDANQITNKRKNKPVEWYDTKTYNGMLPPFRMISTWQTKIMVHSKIDAIGRLVQ